ncbi:MAG: hypothetical protein Kow00124_32470 [Anaerolineae bacterium]
MLARFLQQRFAYGWQLYCWLGMHPLRFQIGARRSSAGVPLNKVSEQADLYYTDVLAAYRDILRRQSREREMIHIVEACCLPGQVEAVTAAYWMRRSHGGPPGASRRLWPEGRWEYPWVVAHLGVEPGMRVLDVGAENSFLPIYLASLGCDVLAVDAWLGSYGEYFTAQVLDRCVDGTFEITVTGPDGRSGRVRWQHQDATALTLPDESFDRVVCISVIEHIPDDRAAIREMARVLRPGGLLALTTPCGPAYQQPGDHPHHKDETGRWTGDLDRVYSAEALQERLVGPSGLVPVDVPAWDRVDWRRLNRLQMVGEYHDYATAAVFLTRPAG